MYISELVKQHGLGIKVRVEDDPAEQKYPHFTVVSQTGEKSFLCRYDDGRECLVTDYPTCNDYELVPAS